MKLFNAVITILILLPILANAQSRRVLSGQWGGDHIRIMVKGDTATIEYDCATGVIDGPLKVDSRGRFALLGTHVPERGGPVRSDEPPRRLAATYSGWTNGRTMTLMVKLRGTNEQIGTYRLRRGSEGRVFRCL